MTLKSTLTLLAALAALPAAHAQDPAPATLTWAASGTSAAAAAYCMAKHPYLHLQKRATADGYTREGYELVGSPGVVGAVRRNFVHDRGSDASDEGSQQTCSQACEQMGKFYGPTMIGKALHQKYGDGSGLIESGLGDIGAMAFQDLDFYMSPPKLVTAGMISRGNTWQNSDVAQADYCCCQVVYR